MAFPRINFKDSDISRFQDNVDTALRPLQAMPMVGGNVITGVSLTSGQDNYIRHGLNHAPQYFTVLKLQVNSTIWSPTGATSPLTHSNADGTFINLRCSTTCTVTLWVN